MTYITAVVFLLAGLATCRAADLRPPQLLPTVKVTRANHKQTVKAVKGQSLAIELEGNPSTGYDWHFTSLDRSRLELIDRSEQPRFAQRLGSPALLVFNLKTLGPGVTTVKMAYFRSWEGSSTAREFLEFTLDVK
jgi:predicted secreted protein